MFVLDLTQKNIVEILTKAYGERKYSSVLKLFEESFQRKNGNAKFQITLPVLEIYTDSLLNIVRKKNFMD